MSSLRSTVSPDNDPWAQYKTSQPSEDPWAQYRVKTEDKNPNQQETSKISDNLRVLNDSLLLGGWDPAIGALKTLGGGSLSENISNEREKTKEARNRLGYGALAPEVVGSLLPAGAIAKGGFTAAKIIPKAFEAGINPILGLLGRTAASGVEGAGYGALSALGHGENIGEGAATGAITGSILRPVVEGVSSFASTLKKKLPLDEIVDSLRGVKNDAYKKVDDIGLRYINDEIDQMLNNTRSSMIDEGISPVRHPKAFSSLDDLRSNIPENPSISDIDKARQRIRRDTPKNDPAEKYFSDKIINNIDNFIGSSDDSMFSNITPGGPDAKSAMEAIASARDLNTKYRKLDDLQEALNVAERSSATSGVGGNIDNRMRQEVRKFADRNNLTNEEMKAADKAIGTKGAPGTTVQNIVRSIGGFSPEKGFFPAMAAIGSGALSAAGPLGPLPLAIPAAGFLAKRASDNFTRNNIDDLARAIISGGKNNIEISDQSLRSNIANLPEKYKEEIIRSLMATSANR